MPREHAGLPSAQSSTLHRSNAGDGAWDLHTGDAVITLTRNGDRSWSSWAVSLPGFEFFGSPVPVNNPTTIRALEDLWKDAQE